MLKPFIDVQGVFAFMCIVPKNCTEYFDYSHRISKA